MPISATARGCSISRSALGAAAILSPRPPLLHPPARATARRIEDVSFNTDSMPRITSTLLAFAALLFPFLATAQEKRAAATTQYRDWQHLTSVLESILRVFRPY